MGVGLLEMREPKSITVGIWQRGRWDVIRDRSDKRELEIEVVEDPVVNGSEVLKFELGVSGMEPLEESDFVIVQERLLKNIGNPLALLCVHWWVVNVGGNGGLMVR